MAHFLTQHRATRSYEFLNGRRYGEIAFVVKNQGTIEHNLVLEVPGGNTVARIAIIEPGQTRRVTASLPAGFYTIYCSLPGHRDAGMAATLRVSP